MGTSNTIVGTLAVCATDTNINEIETVPQQPLPPVLKVVQSRAQATVFYPPASKRHGISGVFGTVLIIR